jgi:hypothetical protein
MEVFESAFLCVKNFVKSEKLKLKWNILSQYSL